MKHEYTLLQMLGDNAGNAMLDAMRDKFVPRMEDYVSVWTGHIDGGAVDNDIYAVLNTLWQLWNADIRRPDEYYGRSMSVTDIILIDGTAYLVESIGFSHIPDFATRWANPSEDELAARVKNNAQWKAPFILAKAGHASLGCIGHFPANMLKTAESLSRWACTKAVSDADKRILCEACDNSVIAVNNGTPCAKKISTHQCHSCPIREECAGND